MTVLLKLDSHLQKKKVDLLQRKPLKSDKKCFSSHLKSSFRYLIVYLNFCHDFGNIGKMALLEKIRYISQFMASQPGK